jgi:glucose/arabinose dehydrogenase
MLTRIRGFEKRRSFMKSSIAFTLAAVLSSGAFAQQQPQTYTPPPPTTPPPGGTATQETPPSAAQTANLEAIFDKLNVSHTGKMTKAEAQAHPTVAANFDAADANHDGVVTKDEFLAAFRPAQ